MKKIIKRSRHGFKILRRFDEDIWNILANRRDSISRTRLTKRKKNFVIIPIKNGKNILSHIYDSYKNDYRYIRLLREKKIKFFLKRKVKYFAYQAVTGEKEFRRKIRNVKAKHYLNKLKLRRFYGNISKKKIKKIFRESFLNSNFLGKSFICLLESRLDVLLYRANFFKSIFSSRQYIFHQGIYVNGVMLYKPNYKVKVDSFIFIKDIDNFYKIMKSKLRNKKIFGTYPAYLEINYKLGCISLYKIPEVKEVPFPFFLNYKHIAYTFFK
jgi:ribosomal protein S4